MQQSGKTGGGNHVQSQQRHKGQRNPRPMRDKFDDLPHNTTKDSTEQSSLMKPFYLEF